VNVTLKLYGASLVQEFGAYSEKYHKHQSERTKIMFTHLSEIQQATREELVQYLESWGTACFDDESTSLLREGNIHCI